MDSGSWKQLSFNKIQPNLIKFENHSIIIEVDKSSSPLIYPMSKTIFIKGFKVIGKVTGEIKSSSDEFEEDVYLRFGLIRTGKRKLNAVQRFFSADWVKQLFEMAPKDKGLGIISFFNLTSDMARINKSRFYPGTDLMEELVLTLVEEDGKFIMKHEFVETIEIAGLWLSSNGDRKQSTFTVRIDSIEINENK